MLSVLCSILRFVISFWTKRSNMCLNFKIGTLLTFLQKQKTIVHFKVVKVLNLPPLAKISWKRKKIFAKKNENSLVEVEFNITCKTPFPDFFFKFNMLCLCLCERTSCHKLFYYSPLLLPLSYALCSLSWLCNHNYYSAITNWYSR